MSHTADDVALVAATALPNELVIMLKKGIGEEKTEKEEDEDFAFYSSIFSC